MLGDFASLDVQNTYRGSDAYVKILTYLGLLTPCLALLGSQRLHQTEFSPTFNLSYKFLLVC
ncbi:hypothetical protein [Piscirickettsia salmonis]|uniref:hypothetical protein n=1 Tax=Piscirickettsia salmonis TaxID=1238 RepID=UPI0004BBF1C8|nr:hypothetical protein [Piscirickettsia salmonis]QHS27511.1 hypothetical protein GW538_16405 [Piscirickettsia salmonis]QHS27671.1 hypothetical protein GW538_17565 [Piscirickettsia salmonis]QHS30853.1 hypothetical protein GW537_17565 [Piscirickettsia salmonis]